MAKVSVSREVLCKQDDSTSSAVCAFFEGNAAFTRASATEGRMIAARDDEDGARLAVGVELSVSRGVLPKDPAVEPVTQINVIGKSADEVARTIAAALPSGGCSVVLQGLSGTGKGTTVAKLVATLPRAIAWSNGNCFRTLTLVALEALAAKGTPLTAANAAELITRENVAEWMSAMRFDRVAGAPGGWDIIVGGPAAAGVEGEVRTLARTRLQESRVAQAVPLVAQYTQGEVVLFAAKCIDALRGDGCSVIVEGRAQTLQYVRTPYRFELVMPDIACLGARRCAQRLAQQAATHVAADATEADVGRQLEAALAALEADHTKAGVH